MRNISAVATCRSNASFNSRVSRATVDFRPSSESAEEVRLRTDFDALGRFSVTALWRCDLGGSSPILERRVIALPWFNRAYHSGLGCICAFTANLGCDVCPTAVEAAVTTPSVVNPNIASDGPTQFLQPLQEPSNAVLCFGIAWGQVHEHPDSPRALALLRARSERPSRRAAEKRDEVASFHVLLLAGGYSLPHHWKRAAR
jgi:hypothetical protein